MNILREITFRLFHNGLSPEEYIEQQREELLSDFRKQILEDDYLLLQAWIDVFENINNGEESIIEFEVFNLINNHSYSSIGKINAFAAEQKAKEMVEDEIERIRKCDSYYG